MPVCPIHITKELLENSKERLWTIALSENVPTHLEKKGKLWIVRSRRTEG